MSDPSLDSRAPSTGTACAIGNFDGVHRGHQAVLSSLGAMARERQLSPVLLTFEPHPAVTLGRPAPARLTTLERKGELCRRACPELVIDARAFTVAFSELSAEAFASEVLRDALDARVVMVGRDFRFGHRRLGNFAELERLGEALGFEAVAQPLLSDDGGVISSTRIRELVALGRAEAAALLLGRPHMFSGTVAHGDGRGKTLGFPTCNLVEIAEALPGLGVYAVVVEVAGSARRSSWKGVANIGRRPTVHAREAAVSTEVHLLDFAGDLYGTTLRVHVVARLRAEQRFADLGELQAQIGRDIDEARERLAAMGRGPIAAGSD